MNETFLLKLSFCVSVVGTIGLLMVDTLYAVKEVKINEITLKEVGKEVTLKAQVMKASVRSENLFVELADETGSITAVAFKSKERLKKGEIIEVEAKIARYKGEPELIVTKLKRPRNDV